MKRAVEIQKEVLLIPLGKVMVDILNEITVALRKTYQCHVKLGRSEEPPTDCYSDERRQFDADKLLTMLEGRKHPKLLAVVGIVDADIFYGEKAFTFGMSKPAKGVAVLSLTRLRQEFYGKPSDIEKTMQRAVKETIFQTGMAANLGVCPQKKCVLSQATALWRLDDKTPKFCELCQEKIDVRILNRKKTISEENTTGEGPEGQPQVVGNDEPTAADDIEDESRLEADILEPEGPVSAEEAAIHNEEKAPREPIDADSKES